ncbi:MAG TPA: FadR/GntR family transcriptional regulator [Candidatus Saccharimonadales bacterium]|nr:FadR/GntR family transcriptional regulator [Candidatus Saccharimonadales bacterium]
MTDLKNVTAGTNHRPLQRSKMGVLIAEAIAEHILEAGLKPGTVLPTESRMVEQYGVGRATVREALRLLELQGLVDVRPGPNGGPVVQEPEPYHVAQLLSIMFSVSGASFSDVIETRLILEPELASRAAVNATDTEIQELADIVSLQHREITDEREFLRLNSEFHTLIAQASRNHVLATFQAAIRKLEVGQQIGVHIHPDSRKGTCRAHERIVTAIQGRDEARATSAMRAHMEAFAEYLAREYPTAMRTPIRMLLRSRVGAEVLP